VETKLLHPTGDNLLPPLTSHAQTAPFQSHLASTSAGNAVVQFNRSTRAGDSHEDGPGKNIFRSASSTNQCKNRSRKKVQKKAQATLQLVQKEQNN